MVRLVKSNDEKGAHCKVCIVSLTKPKDKLSTTGYGWTGQGEGRLMNPIPSEQKLIDHEDSPMHKFNQLNQYPGFLHLSDWKKALIGGSFDGASVMLGSLEVVHEREDALALRRVSGDEQ